MHLSRSARLGCVTHIAGIYSPGNFSIMAGSAKLAVDDSGHVYIISAGLEFESQIGMADLAGKAYPVKPVRENDRPHARRIRVIVDNYVAIFGLGSRRSEHHHPG